MARDDRVPRRCCFWLAAAAVAAARADASDEGTVYVAMTDADGDFIRYQLTWSASSSSPDGTEVDTLPITTA